MTEFCEWCFRNHNEGTKIKVKHDRLLVKVTKGFIPCNLGQCNPYICDHLRKILRAGLQTLDTNCNHILAELNSIDHSLSELKKKVGVGGGNK